ncbi:MAG: hypothetical protein AAF530_17715 [Pseudomonadota bacterium]
MFSNAQIMGQIMSYIRFVAFERPGANDASYGPFPLAYQNARHRTQPLCFRRALRDQLDWFEDYLPVPDRFSHKLGRTSRGIGVCWFKPQAKTHIGRMREMCGILEEIGYPIDCYRADRPGLPIYQDAYQLVALDHKIQSRKAR